MTKMLAKLLTSQLGVVVFLCVGSFPQASAAQTADTLPAALSDIKVDHVTISVQDMDREAEWYTHVLGFKETSRQERPAFSMRNLRNPNFRIDLIKYPGSTRTPANPVYLQQGWVHLALTVPDIPAALAALKALGTDVKGGGMALELHDPEGNEIEIFAQK